MVARAPLGLPAERKLLVLLTHFVPRWRDAMLLVKPETVLRRHREGFRLAALPGARLHLPPSAGI
ncbi:MAG TPA: hypothetical protein VF395_04235 [Polyangiaceae bacterium]